MENPFEILEHRISNVENKLDLILEKLELHKPEIKYDDLWCIQETSEYLRLTVSTIYSKVSRREIPCVKRSGRLYFKKTELDNWLDEGRRFTLDEIDKEANDFLVRKKIKKL